MKETVQYAKIHRKKLKYKKIQPKIILNQIRRKHQIHLRSRHHRH